MNRHLETRIQELQQKSRQLQETTERLQTVLGSMVEGVIAVDASQRILLANPAAMIVQRIQHPSRSASRSKVRWVSMRQPQIAMGRISMMAPRPRICIKRSAPIAPG